MGAREGDTQGERKTLHVSPSRAPILSWLTTSRRLLRRLSNVVLEIRSTTRKVISHFEPLAQPTEKPPHEN